MMSKKSYGVLLGAAAFTAWGFLPAYWKQMHQVNPFEILCHRVIWSCIFLFMILVMQKRGEEVKTVFQNPGHMKGLFLSGLLIGFNWFIYIVAVNSGHITETSLGYYINPMMNVLIGYLLLSETFSRYQVVAVGFAATGVLYSLIAYGSLPFFALALALSFAFYGYARKKIEVAPIPGLFVETVFLFLPALGYIVYRQIAAESLFFHDTGLTFWMIGSGVVTSLPLLWFAGAAKTLNLSTIGILQYLAPSIAFVLGVFVYKESFTLHNLITFACIWTGVLLYTLPLIRYKNKP
jgi:chloramphenicol-sensitive protein RarD